MIDALNAFASNINSGKPELIELQITSYSKTLGKNVLYETNNDYADILNSGRLVTRKSQNRTKNEINISAQVTRRYLILRDEYIREMEKYGDYIKCEPKKADTLIFELINHISKINFHDAALEFSRSGSAKFTLLLEKNNEANFRLVITSLLYSLDELPEGSVIFSIFRESTLLLSNVLPVTSLVEGINAFLAD